MTSTVDDAEVVVDDRTIPVEVSAAPVYDPHGRIAYAIVAFSDVTERRRGEEALRTAKEAAETANRTKSDFLARMSHELRTPLNSVIGFANILLKNKSSNLLVQDLAFLQRILENGKHLLLLINDILDLSKIEAGKVQLETESVDLRELILSTVHQFDSMVKGGDIELKVQMPDAVDPLVTDPARLRQVLINLIGNAVKFTERGNVTVKVETQPGSQRAYRIAVIDTGIGIPDDRLDAIFDAFEQADSSTTRKYGGTGLGLPISRALCELLGYRLSVRSRIGAGTQFTIDMISDQPTEADSAGAATSTALERPPRQLGNRRARILVIDEDADARQLLRELLAERATEVHTATDGQDALNILRDFEPDIVITDLLMPVMDGLTFLEIFRGTPRFQHVPVIVVSAKDITAEERDRLNRHSAAVLRKGNALEGDLRRVLRSILSDDGEVRA